jgi:DNA recombination protein RmuC
MESFKKMLKAKNETEKRLYLKEFIRTVKKHINDISRKYILPHEGTVEFALMYVPSETVYYDIIQHYEEIDSYAYQHKVFMVSPNSFYYFLRILLMGLAGQKLQENTRQILKNLQAIQKDAERFSASLSILSTHLTNAKQALDRVNTEYARLSGKIENIKLLK